MTGSKFDTFETKILQYIFQNITASNIGDTTGLRGSVASGSLYVSLHTSAVESDYERASSGQQTAECSYLGYARQPIERNSSCWSVTGNIASNITRADFPTCTNDLGSPQVPRYFGIGAASSGTGKLLYFGPISPIAAITTGMAVQLPNGGIVITED